MGPGLGRDDKAREFLDPGIGFSSLVIDEQPVFAFARLASPWIKFYETIFIAFRPDIRKIAFNATDKLDYCRLPDKRAGFT
jgi:hypothetical protein